MAPTQYFTLGFCSASIFLMREAWGGVPSKMIIEELFHGVQEQSKLLGETGIGLSDLKYLFIPSDDLITLLTPLKTLRSRPVEDEFRYENEAAMLDDVQITTEKPFSSVTFTFEASGKNGTGKIVCKESDCDWNINKLQKLLQVSDTKDYKLFSYYRDKPPCISEKEDYSMSVSIPWKKISYEAIRADFVLKKFVGTQTIEDRILQANLLTMENDKITFSIDAELPPDLHPLIRDYIRQSVTIFNINKKRFTFPQTPVKNLPGMVRAQPGPK